MSKEKHIMPGVYQHSKSKKRYLVVGSSLHTESNEVEVFYKPLYESDISCFHRPLDMFLEMVEIDGKSVKRFSLIKENHRVYTPMDIQTITPDKDDVIIVNVPSKLQATQEMSTAIQEGLKESFPYNEVVVMSHGLSLKTEKK